MTWYIKESDKENPIAWYRPDDWTPIYGHITPIIKISYRKDGTVELQDPVTDKSFDITLEQLISIVDSTFSFLTGKDFELSVNLPADKEQIMELYRSKIESQEGAK